MIETGGATPAEALAAAKQRMAFRGVVAGIRAETRTALAKGDAAKVSALRGRYNQVVADFTGGHR